MIKRIDESPVDLHISMEKVCFLITKARERSAKDIDSETNMGANPTDDRTVSVLEDQSYDAVDAELTGFLTALTEEELTELLALTWLGRGDGDLTAVRATASRVYEKTTTQYLLGEPLVADFLQAGLDRLGRSCDEVETQHL